MSRIRSIKPEFFLNEEVATVSPIGRLLFIGLWTLADRAGRLEWRPRRIKAQLFPWDDCDVEILGRELHRIGVLIIYQVDNRAYVEIRNFTKHQKFHHSEPPSSRPGPSDEELNTWRHGVWCVEDGERGVVCGERARAPEPPGALAGSEDPMESIPPPGSQATATDIGASVGLAGNFLDAFVTIAGQHPSQESLERAAREFKRRCCESQYDAIAALTNHQAWLALETWSGRDRALHWFFVDGTWRAPPSRIPTGRAHGPPRNAKPAPGAKWAAIRSGIEQGEKTWTLGE